MKSRLFFIFLFLAQFTLAQTSENIELIYEYNRGDERYSGSWSYVDEEDREYALIGAKSGTAVYLLEENNPTEIGFIPGPSSNWREITVLGDYAYVVTEGWQGDLGMQIIDLSSAPDSIALVNTIDQYFGTAHIIQKSIFEESPYIYVAGADVLSGVTIFDCSDPVNPTFVNYYSPGHYVHDIHIRDTLLFTAGIYDNIISIVSIADPMNPITINAIEDPGNMTHSFSTSPDMNYLFVADEDDGYPMRTFDISDLLNIEEVNTYTANEESLVHNPYTNGIFTYVSHNTEGLRVLDSRDPELLHEVGFYDTFEGPSGGYFGLWSACPYLPSGRIIGADRTRGLMLWSFNGTQAARFYAEIVDANTGEIINTASFLNDTNEELAEQGEVKWVGDAGSYNFTVNACLLYTSPSPRDKRQSRMPSSA